ncbi:MAG TPA: Rieske 2Fe-2S domain-containing protein, partial [Patescibacteria group bacterium]|nr:Rieske 2Fe-2S domain-containing protein [Patescibacteria group bacterium]
MTDKPEDRVERAVSKLLRGKRLAMSGGDADEKDALIAAARLVAARQAPHHMSPGFRKRLARSLAQAPDASWITRRTALVAGLGLAAGAAAGGLVGRSMAPEPQGQAGRGPIDPVDARWVDVAALSDLVEGQGHSVKAGAVNAYVFRRGSTVTAVSSICTHLPC